MCVILAFRQKVDQYKFQLWQILFRLLYYYCHRPKIYCPNFINILATKVRRAVTTQFRGSSLIIHEPNISQVFVLIIHINSKMYTAGSMLMHTYATSQKPNCWRWALQLQYQNVIRNTINVDISQKLSKNLGSFVYFSGWVGPNKTTNHL